MQQCTYHYINAVIVCELYKERRNSDCIILTELYTAFSLTLLIHYLSDQKPSGKLDKFDKLPPKDYQKFLTLCEIAYKGINNKNQQLIFSESDFPNNFETFGFMQSVSESHISSGLSVSYNFLHLTIQEFLAAYHLSQKSDPEQVQKFILTNDIDADSGCMVREPRGPTKSASTGTVARFLAGITKLQNDVWSKQLPVPSTELVAVEVELAQGLARRSRTGLSDDPSNTTTQKKLKRTCFSYGQLTYNNATTKAQCHVFLKGMPHTVHGCMRART